ncbi:MAG: hypothetical protein WCT02_03595 [Candidatus Paceibacterota bacterium]
MTSWSHRRKSSYAIVVIAIVLVAVTSIAFLFFYKTPTCFDGIQNGGEGGIDCGGRCSRLCQSSFLPPSVTWTRFEKVAPGFYNVAAYIVNPNVEGTAFDAPYRFSLYDSKGILIVEREGVVTLPPHRNTLAFQAQVSVGQREPVKAIFEFIEAGPNWQKASDQLSSLVFDSGVYTEDQDSSSLSATLKNVGVQNLGRMSVYAVLKDAEGNAIGFSKTVIDGIPAKSMVTAPFTWPFGRNGRVISQEVLPVAE